MQDAVARARRRPAGTTRLEYRVVWPDGSLHWVEVRARVSQGRRRRPPADDRRDAGHHRAQAARGDARCPGARNGPRSWRPASAVFAPCSTAPSRWRCWPTWTGAWCWPIALLWTRLARPWPRLPAARCGRRHGGTARRRRRGGLSQEFPRAVAGRIRPLRGRTRAPDGVAPGARLLAEAGSRRWRRGRPGGGRRPRHHRPEADGGDATPVAEAGDARPADRQRRARLQQSADGRDRQSRPVAPPGATAIPTCCAWWRVRCRGRSEVQP